MPFKMWYIKLFWMSGVYVFSGNLLININLRPRTMLHWNCMRYVNKNRQKKHYAGNAIEGIHAPGESSISISDKIFDQNFENLVPIHMQFLFRITRFSWNSPWAEKTHAPFDFLSNFYTNLFVNKWQIILLNVTWLLYSLFCFEHYSKFFLFCYLS